MLTPKQLRAYQFEQSSEGTYRADEVDMFLNSLCNDYTKIYTDNGEMLQRINKLAELVKEYKDEEELIKKTLLVAQKKADEIEETSRRQSETRIADAERQAKEKTESAEKRAAELKIASEERARTVLADANQKSSAMLKSARETAEKTTGDARAKAAAILSEAKTRADQMLAQAQATSNEILGSIRDEAEREKEALASIRAQSRSFKRQLTDSCYQQINNAERILGFVDEDDGLGEKAVEAAKAVTPISAPQTVEVPVEPQPEEPAQEPEDEKVFTSEDDELFISSYVETVDPSAPEEEPASAEEPIPAEEPAEEIPQESAAPQEPAANEDSHFTLMPDYDALVSDEQPAQPVVDDIPEFELEDIDKIFQDALSAAREPQPQPEPEIDLSKSMDQLKQKYSDPDNEEIDFAKQTSRLIPQLPDEDEEYPEYATQTPRFNPPVLSNDGPVDNGPTIRFEPIEEPAQEEEPAAEVAPQPEVKEEKPEKKHRRFSLFSRYEDDDDEDEDEDEDEEEDDDEDDEDGGFHGLFRK